MCRAQVRVERVTMARFACVECEAKHYRCAYEVETIYQDVGVYFQVVNLFFVSVLQGSSLLHSWNLEVVPREFKSI